MLYQQHLPFDAEQLFDLQHSSHCKSIAVVARQGNEWREGLPRFHHNALSAIRESADLSHQTACDAYVSQSGFIPKQSRAAVNVGALTSLWVDLDYYHTDYRNLTPDQLLEVIKADYPWLPMPTALTDSGRGCYLHWIFDQALEPKLLPQWQKAMHAVTAILKPYGSDRASAESARVLRIVGSLHPGTGHTVRAWDTGPTYHWYRLRDAFYNNYWKPRESKARENPNTPRGTVTFIQTGYTRAFRAIQDINLLAQIRRPVVDCRHRILLCAAMASGLFCPSSDSMIDQLVAITKYFDVDAKYDKQYSTREQLGKRFKTVIEKASDHRDGAVIQSGEWEGKTVAYTPGKGYYIDECEITRAEQRQMGFLFGEAEKKRRYRRQKGIPERSEQLLAARHKGSEKRAQRANQKRQEAIALFAQGLSRKHIQVKLGISERSLREYLNGN